VSIAARRRISNIKIIQRIHQVIEIILGLVHFADLAILLRRKPSETTVSNLEPISGHQQLANMAMAMATQLRTAGFSPFPPRLSSPMLSSASRFASAYVRQLSVPFLPAITLAIPASIQRGLPSIPSLLEGIWDSILRAVPKKKTSHMKKRHRQMAGKALKDVNSLCKCPACGRTKRMHHLCPYCMQCTSLSLERDPSQVLTSRQQYEKC